MKLVDLQKKAVSGYSNGEPLGTYFDPETGKHTDWEPGDTLEWFMAIELEETFDEDADDDSQIATAIQVLERAVEDLQGAISGLYAS